jgi:NAD(P)-dependent dehydrogenase (short-subunit alcohol dehydrogenase family)
MTEAQITKKSVFIGVGCSSAIAREILTQLPPYDTYLLLSRSPGRVSVAGNDIDLTLYDSRSIENLQQIVDDPLLPSKKEVGKVDIVSFLGAKDNVAFINQTSEQIENVINVNLALNSRISSLLIKKYLGTSMSIVYLSSSGALAGDAGVTMYSATKYALNGLCKGISMEYGRYGVNANVLALGVVSIGMSSEVSQKRLSEMVKRSANRKPVEISNITNSLVFLLSNNDVNGTILACDGGYL